MIIAIDKNMLMDNIHNAALNLLQAIDHGVSRDDLKHEISKNLCNRMLHFPNEAVEDVNVEGLIFEQNVRIVDSTRI